MPKRLIPSIPEEESFEQTLVPEQQPTQQTAYEEPQEQEIEPEVDETELEDDEDEPVYVKSAKKQPKKGKRKAFYLDGAAGSHRHRTGRNPWLYRLQGLRLLSCSSIRDRRNLGR